MAQINQKIKQNFTIHEMASKGVKTYRDDWGHTALIEPLMMYPYRDAPRKTQAFRLWIESDCKNDFAVVFVSIYDTLEAAESKLKSFSCGTYKEIERNR